MTTSHSSELKFVCIIRTYQSKGTITKKSKAFVKIHGVHGIYLISLFISSNILQQNLLTNACLITFILSSATFCYPRITILALSLILISLDTDICCTCSIHLKWLCKCHCSKVARALNEVQDVRIQIPFCQAMAYSHR